jgi:hypothetical protein
MASPDRILEFLLCMHGVAKLPRDHRRGAWVDVDEGSQVRVATIEHVSDHVRWRRFIEQIDGGKQFRCCHEL